MDCEGRVFHRLGLEGEGLLHSNAGGAAALFLHEGDVALDAALAGCTGLILGGGVKLTGGVVVPGGEYVGNKAAVEVADSLDVEPVGGAAVYQLGQLFILEIPEGLP